MDENNITVKVRRLIAAAQTPKDMERYITHEGFFTRLEEDFEIFGAVTDTDFDAVVLHIRSLEAYAGYVHECIQAEKTPDTFEVFYSRWRLAYMKLIELQFKVSKAMD